MGGIAKDYGSFMMKLMGSQELKDLMLIPEEEQLNYIMIDKYFVESATSELITESPDCRLVVTSNPQVPTNNPYVKEDMLAIEVFVYNKPGASKDRIMLGFQRRSNCIVDEIIKLFNNKSINDRKLRLETRRELSSGSPGYCRMYVCFSYFKVYN